MPWSVDRAGQAIREVRVLALLEQVGLEEGVPLLVAQSRREDEWLPHGCSYITGWAG